jgi:hypothetical protein
LGFRVLDSNLGFRHLRLEFEVQAFEFRVWASGLSVSSFEFRLLDSQFGVQAFEF